MRKNILLLGTFLLMIACAPIPTKPTTIPDPTLTPTKTSTPLPTYTPTALPTLTQTPFPTPLGGGNGILLVSGAPVYKDGILSEPGGLYQVNSDGTELVEILSSAQIRSFAGDNYGWAIYNADHSQNYIITKNGFYIVDDDWRVTQSIKLQYSKSISSYSDWTHILWKDASEYYYLTNGETGSRTIIGPTNIIGLSADRNTIYTYDNQSSDFYARNTDGSSLRELKLDTLKLLATNEESIDTFEWKSAIYIGTYYNNQMATLVTTSPGRGKTAFVWKRFLFITDPADVEFSDPVLLATLPYSGYNVIWSPDEKYLLVGLVNCDRGCGRGDVVLINAITGEVKTVSSYQEPIYISACGFSPDRKQIVFHFMRNYSEFNFITRLMDFHDNSYKDIEGSLWNCPVWR